MKHQLFYFFVLTWALLAACSSEEEKFLSANVSKFEVESIGGNQTLLITSNTEWEIGCNPPQWIKTSTKAGSGNAQLTISISANDEYERREGYILISSKSIIQTIRIDISQAQKDALLVSDNKIDFSWEGGMKELSYQYNVDNEVVIPTSETWVHIARTKSLSSGKLTISVDENTAEKREATIVLKGKNVSTEITISQDAFIPLETLYFQEGEYLLLENNNNVTLNPVFVPNDCSDKNLEWTSSNNAVIDVNPNGELIIKGNGTSMISAYNKKSDKTIIVFVTVKIKAEKFELMNNWGSYLDFVEGNWGYSFTPAVKVVPNNAYIDDLEFISGDESLVSVTGKTLVCNNQYRTGTTQVTANLPYSGLSSSFDISVRCLYIKAGLGLISQGGGKFLMAFSGMVYSNNLNDKIKIEGLTIVDENNYVITFDTELTNNNTNYVHWNTIQIDLVRFGIDTFTPSVQDRLSKWKAICTYRFNGSNNIMSESENINPHIQY